MRTIWSTVAFFAVVNLLALLLAAGWLYQTDRIDRARVEQVRTLFRLPIAEEKAILQASLDAEAAASIAAADDSAVRWSAIPVTNLATADAAERTRDLGRETSAALQLEAEAIVARIEADHAARMAEVAAERRSLEADQQRFRELTERTRDADFAKTVTDLEEMKMDTAFSIIQTWWANDEHRTLVIDVLASMDTARRNSLLGEFVDVGRQDVAAELQLALRDRTAMAGSRTESADAQLDDKQASRGGNRPVQGPGGSRNGVGTS